MVSHKGGSKLLSKSISGVPENDESLNGLYCVVSYDAKPYPGVILDTDDGEIEVQVIHSIGRNRFFWPILADVLWYKRDQLVTLIDPPDKVTNRHFQIKKESWAEIENKLNI